MANSTRYDLERGSMWRYSYANELKHYGILGMRWGIRRFQDKSGRLTRAGQKRYGNDNDKDHKRLEDMTDAELQRMVNRLNLENQYKNLTRKPETKSRGQQMAENILKFTGSVIVVSKTAIDLYNKYSTIRNIMEQERQRNFAKN